MHEGHRERLRQRYIREGIDNFSEHEVVELILSYAIPRINVNPIAHCLVKRFGSLSGVLEAGVGELCAVDGIGPASAVLIKLFSDVGRKYQLSKCGKRPLLNTIAAIGRYCVALTYGLAYENLFVICLDAQKRLINAVQIEEGTPGEIQIQVRKLIEVAIQNKADSIVLTHNHPSGSAMPSDNDIMSTNQIITSFKTVGIPVIDHIIVSEMRYTSMTEMGLIKGRM